MTTPVKRNIKQFNQNIFDFVLSNYGNLEYLSDFLNQNSISIINDFSNQTGIKFSITVNNNFILSQYNKFNKIVATDRISTDIVLGDFSNDFSDDFFI